MLHENERNLAVKIASELRTPGTSLDELEALTKEELSELIKKQPLPFEIIEDSTERFLRRDSSTKVLNENNRIGSTFRAGDSYHSDRSWSRVSPGHFKKNEKITWIALRELLDGARLVAKVTNKGLGLAGRS